MSERWSMDGRVDGEDSVAFYNKADRLLECIETPDGMRLIVPGAPPEIVLDAEQTHRLGRFCVKQFMGEDPQDLLDRIRRALVSPLGKLNAWNERARADEEHPPYDDITRELEQIKGIVDELEQGLRRP